MASLEFGSSHNIQALATSPAPLPTMNFDASTHMQPILPTGTSQVDATAVGQIPRNLAQERCVQTRWQQQAQHRLQARQQQTRQQQTRQQQQQQQQHGASIDQQQHYRQGDFPEQQQQLEQQQNIVSAQAQHTKQLQRQNESSPSHAAPSLPPTPRLTAEQSTGPHNSVFASALADYPQLQKSIATGFLDTAQQFTLAPATAQHPNKVAFQVVPQIAHSQSISTSKLSRPDPNTPSFLSSAQLATASTEISRREGAAASWAERAHRNEVAERLRLDCARKQEIEQRERKLRATQDPNAIYYNYREVLEYFPLRRSEHPNPYLLGLLANQSLPDGALSDRGLAIQYAKDHWESYWELEDLAFVAEQAKKARGQLNGAPLTAHRR